MTEVIPDAARAQPFLTVLVRTQGHRSETLRDAFLCLQAQTCSDFEVLLAVHDATPSEQARARQVVQDLPSSLRNRTCVMVVDSGGRARPLNEGFERARGAYVAVLDDDDLVLAHWVECFKRMVDRSPGAIVRSVPVRQDIEQSSWSEGRRQGIRTIGGLSRDYPPEFDLIAHFSQNRTPFMALAFPIAVFRDLGVHFDESLDICEDWDFQLRAALAVGVTGTDSITCVYRRWSSGPSSESIHTADNWRLAERSIIARLDEDAHVFPPGTIGALRGDTSGSFVGTLLAELHELRQQVDRLETSRSWRLTRPLRFAAGLLSRKGLTRSR